MRRSGTRTVSTVPAPGAPLKLQHAAQLVDPLANAEQAEMAAGADRPASMRQPAAVVAHRQLDAVRVEPQQDVDPPRAGVLQRVGERLEADAQQVVLVGRVEPPRRSLRR